jgi:hypothetical protein
MGFVRGTLIQSSQSMIPVELLKQDSLVRNESGELVPCRWVGCKRLTQDLDEFMDFLPIKISADAFDQQVPCRDLYLLPEHGVLVDGHLVHARALINGTSIVQMTEWQGEIEFYHVETANHEIIDVEGLACETFFDEVSRRQFDNFAEFEALYGEAAVISELPLPRVRFKRQLPRAIAVKLGIIQFEALISL